MRSGRKKGTFPPFERGNKEGRCLDALTNQSPPQWPIGLVAGRAENRDVTPVLIVLDRGTPG